MESKTLYDLIERIEICELKPGDVIFVTPKTDVSDSEFYAFSESVKNIFGEVFPNNKTIVLRGASVEIYRKSAIDEQLRN